MADTRGGEGTEVGHKIPENGSVGHVHGGEGLNTANQAPKLQKGKKQIIIITINRENEEEGGRGKLLPPPQRTTTR